MGNCRDLQFALLSIRNNLRPPVIYLGSAVVLWPGNLLWFIQSFKQTLATSFRKNHHNQIIWKKTSSHPTAKKRQERNHWKEISLNFINLNFNSFDKNTTLLLWRASCSELISLSFFRKEGTWCNQFSIIPVFLYKKIILKCKLLKIKCFYSRNSRTMNSSFTRKKLFIS